MPCQKGFDGFVNIADLYHPHRRFMHETPEFLMLCYPPYIRFAAHGILQSDGLRFRVDR